VEEEDVATDRTARDREDQRLLEAGDYATLLAAYYPTILLRLRAKRLPLDEAEEVRQRVVEYLLGQLRSGKRFDVPFRVVVHQRTTWMLLDYFKQRSRRPEELAEETADLRSDPIERLESDLDFGRLVEDLPAREKEVVVLRWRTGLEVPQIAEMLGMTANAVHQALFRAHKKLRDGLG
jgi:RNA polymerase sigma-70 factor (ECF subfamily)